MRRQIEILIAGRAARVVGLDPDLQELGRGVGRGVELGVFDTIAGRHVLEFARLDGAAVSEGILVAEFPRNDVGEDFHRAMRMGAEALPGRDGVLVDDAERFEAPVIGMIVSGEGKGMVGIEPAMVGVEAVIRPPDGQLGCCHGRTMPGIDYVI